MEDTQRSTHEELTSLIMDGEDVIGTVGDEVVINDADESQKEEFKLGVEK